VELFYAVLLFVYLSNIFRHVYLRRLKLIFIPDAHGTENRRRKRGAYFWRRKMESIYGAGF